MFTRKHVLLTGATGHVGGRLFERLAQQGIFNIRGVGLSRKPKPVWIKSHELRFGDIRSESLRRELMQDVDVVVHLANRGFSAANQPQADKLAEERSTTLALARDAVKAKVSRFVFLSSIHVFGKTLVGKVDDDTSAEPTSEYGASRLQIEDDLAQLTNQTGLEVIAIRMCNSFGAPAFPRAETWDLVLHDLCRQAVQSDSLILRSDPRTSRDVIALRDAVDTLSQIIRSPGLTSGTYLLASGNTSTLLDLAQAVQQLARLNLGRELEIQSASHPFEHPPSFTFDCTKLRTAGIIVPQHREEEICDLLSYAQSEFGMTQR